MSDERPIPKNMPEDPKERWEKAREMAESGDDCDFRWWVFPVDIWSKGFLGVTFKGKVSFESAEIQDGRFLKCVFNKYASFANALFTENEANFHDVIFQDASFFENAIFRSSVIFSNATFGQKTERHIPFGCNFNNVHFLEATCFLYSTFFQHTQFEDCIFFDGALFVECVFKGDVTFADSFFRKDAHFNLLNFENNAGFERVSFGTSTNYLVANMRGIASFAGASSEGDIRFAGVTTSNIVELDCPKISLLFPWQRKPPYIRMPWIKNSTFKDKSTGQSAYRLAKQSVQNQGDYTKAGEYHYAEQTAIEAGLPWYKRWPRFIFGRLIFGYGEKPERPAIASLLVILLCAIIYCLAGNLGGSGIVQVVNNLPVTITSPWTSLYFSVVTFTTLGYGDMQPTGWMRGVAGFEALCGAGLMAAFVVVLSRKFVR
jgi:hypothetical protein